MGARLRTRAGPATRSSKLQRLDLHHARHGLNGDCNLRRDLEAARKLHLDFGAAVEQEHHTHLAVAIGRRAYVSLRRPGGPALRYWLQSLRNRVERRAIAQEYAQTLLQIPRGSIPRLCPPEGRARPVRL